MEKLMVICSYVVYRPCLLYRNRLPHSLLRFSVFSFTVHSIDYFVVVSAGTQTVITFPINFDLLKLLGPGFNYLEEKAACDLGNSSLRRKLFGQPDRQVGLHFATYSSTFPLLPSSLSLSLSVHITHTHLLSSHSSSLTPLFRVQPPSLPVSPVREMRFSQIPLHLETHHSHLLKIIQRHRTLYT